MTAYDVRMNGYNFAEIFHTKNSFKKVNEIADSNQIGTVFLKSCYKMNHVGDGKYLHICNLY